MYSNNIVNFQESTTILNACTKKSGNLLTAPHTLAPYLCIICRDYVLQTSIDLMKENGFTLKQQEAGDTPQKLLQTQIMQMT